MRFNDRRKKRRKRSREMSEIPMDESPRRRRKRKRHRKQKNQRKQNSHRNQKNYKNRKKKVAILLSVAVVLILAMAGGGILWKMETDRQKAAIEAANIEAQKLREKQQKQEAEARELEEQKDMVVGYSVESGISVFDAIKERPPFIELTDENRQGFVDIQSCLIDDVTDNILVEASAEGIAESDDKFYYLFALRTYQDAITEDSIPMDEVYKDEKMLFRIPVFFTGTRSGVFYKFVVAVKQDDKFVAVSTPHYITNPEEVAKYRSNGDKPSSKKGLLIDPNKLRTPELDDLGVKHAAYNVPVSRILGQSTSAIYPTINYTYNGKNYAFNGQVMSEYDLVFSTLSAKGIEITAIILNDVSYAYPQLIHPLARAGIGSAPYYAFNATDEAGCEYLAAVGAFLAERYSGSANGRGLVANWVIGNEINARKEWNYMEYIDLKSYVEEYARAYRVFYNSIKSINSACNIYISLDQQWDRNIKSSKNYDTKDVLDEFNRQIKAEGNIDWGLAMHPYNVPLTTPYTWNKSKYVKHSLDTSMVTMDNIEIVTDYLSREEFLTDDGEVRSIILSEQGYTSLNGENVQAAAIVYAYKKAEANEHIDSILFSRQTDAVEEIAQGLALGINHADGSPKYAYQVFKYMDTDKQEAYTDFAKGIIGISDWSQIE